MPIISIVVPVYKVEKYIRRCIDSILAQTFTDFELILVDDGSPDNCGAICDEYAAKDHRIKVIHKPNGGVSAARNTALDAATGRYIMFCDSDDFVSPEWCQVMLNAIEEYPSALITSEMQKVDEEASANREDCGTSDSAIEDVSYYTVYNRGLSGFTWNKIFRRDIIEQNHLRFDENRRIGEDVQFVISYCAFCESYMLIKDPLYYYVQRKSSAVHILRPDILEHQLFTFYIRTPLLKPEELEEFCDTNLCSFIHYFDAVFTAGNTASLCRKLAYNNRMLNSEAFRFCLEHASGKRENPLAMKILRTHNYYLYWLFQKLVGFKKRIWRK